MKIEQKIGVIGNGFVGNAVQFGFSQKVGCEAEVRVYDKNPSKSTHSLEETVNKSDFIFLSVPTPANEDGSIIPNNPFEIVEMIRRYNSLNDATNPSDALDDALESFNSLEER